MQLIQHSSVHKQVPTKFQKHGRSVKNDYHNTETTSLQINTLVKRFYLKKIADSRRRSSYSKIMLLLLKRNLFNTIYQPSHVNLATKNNLLSIIHIIMIIARIISLRSYVILPGKSCKMNLKFGNVQTINHQSRQLQPCFTWSTAKRSHR